MAKKPVVLIPANVIDYNGSPGYIVRETYVDALTQLSDCLPLILPPLGSSFNIADLKDSIDGILLTGSPSHVAPSCYGEAQVFEDKELDRARDATTLPLIKAAIDADIPLIAVCRGFQELNVAMGGTLHQRVHELPGKLDHRKKPEHSVMESYRHPAHKVTAQKGGMFEKFGLPSEFTVNTVHQQGVNKLGNHLHVEALAEDGLIEAISVPGRKFILGTQWHPEGDWDRNATSKTIFEKFGQALRA